MELQRVIVLFVLALVFDWTKLTPTARSPAHECTGLPIVDELLHGFSYAHTGRFFIRVHRLRNDRFRGITRDHFDDFLKIIIHRL